MYRAAAAESKKTKLRSAKNKALIFLIVVFFGGKYSVYLY